MARIRLLGLTTALVLGLAATQVLAGGTGTVSIDSLTIDVGQQGTVRLQVADHSELLGAWTIDVNYDPAVVQPADCVSSYGGICDLDQGETSLRIISASAEGLTGDFTLATIAFNCVAEGSSSLSMILDVWGIPTVEFAPPPPEVLDGAITCVAPSSTPPVLPETGAGAGIGTGEGRPHWFIVALAFGGLTGILAASARRMLSSF